MTGTQLDRFFDEVMYQGAHALLPQHLPEEWLQALLHEAALWQQREYHPDLKVPGLLAAVLAILDAQQGHPMRTIGSLSVSSPHLLACMTRYAQWLVLEEARRAYGVVCSLPTLETIFAESRYTQH
jgi:hypothetical protein